MLDTDHASWERSANTLRRRLHPLRALYWALCIWPWVSFPNQSKFKLRFPQRYFTISLNGNMLQCWNIISKVKTSFKKICVLVVLRSISLNYSSQLYQVVTYRWCGKKSQMATFVGILFTPGQFRNILVHKFPWFFGKFPNVGGRGTVRVQIIAA